jgi:hypothetical protein
LILCRKIAASVRPSLKSDRPARHLVAEPAK